MTNEQLLAELKTRLASGELHPDSIRALLPRELELVPKTEIPWTTGTQALDSREVSKGLPVTRLLYIIGGILVILGVLYLASQLWVDLSVANRILLTLGLGVVCAGVGSVLMVLAPEREAGDVFHVIGGFLVPGGALVALDELVSGITSTWPVTLTIAMVFFFYLLLVLYHRRVVLNFFVFLNGTALAYLLLDTVIPTANADIYAYLTMVIGVSYLLYGYLFQQGWNDRLIPVLYLCGSVGFYAGAFSQLSGNLFMEFLYPFLAFGGLVLAATLFASRIILVIATGSVIAYIIYFTAEYFADSIGWPVALILLGFITIGIGYLSIMINRKYILPNTAEESG